MMPLNSCFFELHEASLKEGRKEGREGGREGGREEGRKGGRNNMIITMIIIGQNDLIERSSGRHC